MNIYTPFVYLLVWASGKMYVGSRTQKGKANPTEILTTYFTSSKVVKKYLKAGNQPIQVLVFPFETAQEALEAETKMLTTFNAKNSGAFFNQHNGDGVFSNAGNVHTEETRNKISNGLKGKYTGEKNHMFGKPLLAATKQKMSNTKKGKPLSAATKQKLSESQSGEKNHNWGKKASKETRQKMSASQKGKKHSAESKQKMRESALKRVENGTHNFLGGELARARISARTHNFLDSEFQRANSIKRVKNGTHHFLVLGMTAFDLELGKCVKIHKEEYHANRQRYFNLNSKVYKDFKLKNQMV